MFRRGISTRVIVAGAAAHNVAAGAPFKMAQLEAVPPTPLKLLAHGDQEPGWLS